MTELEYKVKIIDWSQEWEQVEEDFNKMGAEGWELVSATPKMGKNDSYTFGYFKRPHQA